MQSEDLLVWQHEDGSGVSAIASFLHMLPEELSLSIVDVLKTLICITM